ncbi:synaptic vesicle glycoprotein 2C-like isoform X2 [Plodia interpunctella]|uniref:synaptic vesicle glycoprotein 2C-like isoform X2 n=1 Tax=Plodia interpunctella TaxID=58824 RepID=UPI002367C7BD|nr:synaptic vesicle glycoprotein 2C-like isoform X2 [Plodia interpunctella]
MFGVIGRAKRGELKKCGFDDALDVIGVMWSSYCWGLAADTLGRRRTLLTAMPVGAVLNYAATLAPGYNTLAIIKFFSASFTSSANAAAFVLVGESAPRRLRSRVMFLMASATMFVQLIICALALPIFHLTFRTHISWLGLDYRPWRLLMQIISLPGVFGALGMACLHESPKFLLSKGRDAEALEALASMYSVNSGKKMDDFPVSTVYLEDESRPDDNDQSFGRRMWHQTAPLFKPPLLKNSLKLYYLLLCAFMTSTGFTMWVPTLTNAYFDGADSSGQTFCQVASRAATSSNSSYTDCNDVIQPFTLYAVMCYSGSTGVFAILLSFIVVPLGKKWTTLLVFAVSAAAGVMLLVITLPILSIALFYLFLHVALILGNVNTFLVELNPTHLRGMATCLSVVVARGFGFVSVQLIATLLADHCLPMIGGYVALVISGMLVAVFLPPDKIKGKQFSEKQNASFQSAQAHNKD